MDAQCISNTTSVCLKAREKHFFLLQQEESRIASTEDCPPLQPFRQMGIQPDAGQEMLRGAWVRIRGKAKRLKERNREMSGRERRVLVEQVEVAPRGPQVISDRDKGTPSIDERSASSKWARDGNGGGAHRGGNHATGRAGEGGEENGGHEARQLRQGTHAFKPGISVAAPATFIEEEEAGDGPAEEDGGGSGPGPLLEVGSRTREERRPGIRPFQDLFRRARMLQHRGQEMEEGRWWRNVEAALLGVDPDDPG